MALEVANKRPWRARRRAGLAGLLTLSLAAIGSSASAAPDDDPFVSISTTVDSVEYDREYHWEIEKTGTVADVTTSDSGAVASVNYDVRVRPNGFTDSNAAITGTITLTGAEDDGFGTREVKVTDVLTTGAGSTSVCETFLPGTGAVPGTGHDAQDVSVHPGGVTTVEYYCEINGDLDGATTTSAATWNEGTTPMTVTATAPVASAAGQPTNAVNETVTILDDDANPGGTSRLIATTNWHDGAKIFSYFTDHDMGGQDSVTFTNTALLEETGQTASATVVATVPVEPFVSIEKTAMVQYDREYLWEIEKRGTLQDGTRTVDYEVEVTPAGYVDSNIKVTGEIRLTGGEAGDIGNRFVTVTDVLDTGDGNPITCEVLDADANAGDLIVAPGETTVVEYVCEVTGDLSNLDDWQNTATATWTEGDVTDNMSVSTGPVAVEDDGPTSEVNKQVTIVDHMDGASPEEFDVGYPTWSADGKPWVFEYVRDVEVEPGECAEFTNTAWIEQTDQAASATVEVCADAPSEEPSDDPSDEPTDDPSDEPSGDKDGAPIEKLPDAGVNNSGALAVAAILATLGVAVIVVRRSLAGNQI